MNGTNWTCRTKNAYNWKTTSGQIKTKESAIFEESTKERKEGAELAGSLKRSGVRLDERARRSILHTSCDRFRCLYTHSWFLVAGPNSVGLQIGSNWSFEWGLVGADPIKAQWKVASNRPKVTSLDADLTGADRNPIIFLFLAVKTATTAGAASAARPFPLPSRSSILA